MIPSGNTGKKIIGELVKLYDAFASESSYESFAIKAAMTMPELFLRSSFCSHPNDDEKLARTLSMLMMEGIVRVALRLLSYQ